MDHTQDIQDGLAQFASGKWRWNRWPRWFAMYARSMSRMLSQDHMRGLKRDPQSTVPLIVVELGIAVEHWVEPPGPITLHDPLEDDPQLGPIIAAATRAAEIEAAPILARHRSDIGNCHLIWSIQKRLLKEQHNIDWKTPAEMNPDDRFD